MEVEIYKMVYKINKYMRDISILGREFVINNNSKGKLIINNRKFPLIDNIPLDKFEEDRLKIRMILNKNIYNKSGMFKYCRNLLELYIDEEFKSFENIEEDIEIIKFNKTIEFEKEENLNGLLDINMEKNFLFDKIEDDIKNSDEISEKKEEYSNKSILYFWNNNLIKNIKDNYGYINLNEMFYNCSSLISLPDISKWNNNNVTNMSFLFYNCSSLLSLPDISKWNTDNVTNMNFLFYNCSSLLSLPDISKWNTDNVTSMDFLFFNCSSLISLPDISKWNTDNVTSMDFLFHNC